MYITSLADDSVGGDTNNDGSTTAPTPGDWSRIFVGGSNSLVTLMHTRVHYGGSGGEGMLHVYGNGQGVLSNSTLSYASGWGIYLERLISGGVGHLSLNNSVVENNGNHGIHSRSHNGRYEVSILDSAIRNNGSRGISLSRANASVHNSNIYGNASHGVFASSNSTVDARHNWWGADSGPSPLGSGDGINYRTCYDSVNRVYYICEYYVQVDPWIGKQAFVKRSLGNSGPDADVQARASDPVNTANGNFEYQYTDLAIATRGLPLAISRFYNALEPEAGPLGWGWTHRWHIYLTEETDGSALVTFGDGHGRKWTWNGSAYQGTAGVHDTLIKHGDGAFTLTMKDQTVYSFHPDGRLDFAEDRNGNRTTLTYDEQLRLVTITEPAGRALSLSYTSPISTGLVSAVTDATGRTVGYVYDGGENLVEVVDVMGESTHMTYDANHRLLTITDANGHTFVNNTYNDRGRVVGQLDAAANLWTFAYDEPERYTIVTNPKGQTTRYEYDGDWRLIRQVDALNQAMLFAYDEDSNRIERVDKRGNTTRYAYDDRGNTTVITDALSSEIFFVYDLRNNLLSMQDPLGRTTSYSYDANSNLLSVTDALGNTGTMTYGAYGLLQTETNAREHTTTYAYDALGYLTLLTDALGNETSFVYDSAGRLLEEEDALGRRVSYTYDAANRTLTVVEPLGRTTLFGYDVVGNRTSVTDPLGGVTTFTYDEKDRLIAVADPLLQTITYGYDSVDNQVSVTDALGKATTFGYDALNRLTSVSNPLSHTTTYTYDANDNRTGVTDANSRKTTYAYDVLNRLVQVQDAAGGVVAYTYDAVGNRTSLTDANTHTTFYAYDAVNRLTGVTDPLGHTTTSSYDAVGNRASLLKADGVTVIYLYDALNRLTAINYPGATIAYTYDAVGNRLSMQDATGTTIYAYDALDRVVTVGNPTGTVHYAYDLNGNRTALTYPGGATVAYAYDSANRLLSVTDAASRMTDYTYDAANRLTQVAYPNDVVGAYVYDQADRLLQIGYTGPGAATIAAFAYTLDAVGNRLSMIDGDGTATYSYDALHRLTSVTYPNGEQVAYAYDPMGNRLSMTSSLAGVTTYSYDVGDRLLSVTAPDSSVINLTWDANGNLAAKGAATYTFDALDRLTQVVDDATTVQFAYDGDGVRLGKTANGVATAYVQDMAAPLPVVLAESTAGQTQTYVLGNDLIAQLDSTGVPSFYHTDGLGSVRNLTDELAQVTDAYSYDVFGSVRAQSGGSEQPFQFTGEQRDGELGLIFLRARYYDPEIGRFASKDVWRGDSTSSQTLNGYLYVMNNPLVYADPSGNIIQKLEEKRQNIQYNLSNPNEYIANMGLALSDPVARGFVLDELSENAKIVGYGSCAVGFASGCAVFTKGAHVVDAINASDTLIGLSTGRVSVDVSVSRAIKMGVGIAVGAAVDKFVAGSAGELVWRHGTRNFGPVVGGYLGQSTSYLAKGTISMSGINGWISGHISGWGLGLLGHTSNGYSRPSRTFWDTGFGNPPSQVK